MNGKKAKKLRKKSKQLMVEWLRSMTPEGDMNFYQTKHTYLLTINL